MVDTLAEKPLVDEKIDNKTTPFPAPVVRRPLTEAIARVKSLTGIGKAGKPTFEKAIRPEDMTPEQRQRELDKLRNEGVRIAMNQVNQEKEVLRAEGGLKDTVIGQVMDIAAQAQAEADAAKQRSDEDARRAKEAEERTTIDDLTGLLNRKGFTEAMTREIAQVERTDEELALLFLDLDGFKDVNDSLGHDVGDHVLRIFAKLLREKYLRGSSDLLARLGGDEFVAGVRGKASAVRERLDAIRETEMPDDINAALRELGIDPKDNRVSTSIGVAQLGADAHNFEALKKLADENMYKDKSGRQGTRR